MGPWGENLMVEKEKKGVTPDELLAEFAKPQVTLFNPSVVSGE
jgi:hypothetical protein